jgi:hypothetical protein
MASRDNTKSNLNTIKFEYNQIWLQDYYNKILKLITIIFEYNEIIQTFSLKLKVEDFGSLSLKRWAYFLDGWGMR